MGARPGPARGVLRAHRLVRHAQHAVQRDEQTCNYFSPRCIMPKSFKLRKVDSCAYARGWMPAARRMTPGVTPICIVNKRLKWPIFS